jgi:uncharacterized membrane protein (DUF4010 family)
MIGMLGVVSGISLLHAPLFALCISLGFLALITIYYIQESKATGDFGVTSELNMLWCYSLSTLLTADFLPTQILVSLAVVGLLIMSAKEKVHSFVDSVHWRHVQQMIIFGLISLVILPYLPDRTYKLSDLSFIPALFPHATWTNLSLVNLQSVWRVVVIMTGLDVAVFIMQQMFGKKSGWILASIFGGLVSSTSTTVALAQSYAKNTRLLRTVTSIILANIASFIPLLLIISSVNPSFVRYASGPFVAMMITGGILVAYLLRRIRHAESNAPDEETSSRIQDLFTIKPALVFAGMFAVMKIVLQIAQYVGGDTGYIIGSTIGGIMGMDAVTINTAQLAEDEVDRRRCSQRVLSDAAG